MADAKAVSLDKLMKVFPGTDGKKVVAVDNVNLDIRPGEMVTLLGPSGCGKTTTLRMVAGFEQPTSGDVRIGQQVVTSLPPNSRDTAMVFQSYALFPHMTVEQNIGYGLRFRKVPKDQMKKRVQEIMQIVGLEGMGSRSPNQLSGGQQQRVALARALVVQPAVLLFDEPLSNLDAKLREQMRDEIRRIQSRMSITAIYVTHDQVEAMSVSDRVVVMNRGQIEQVGAPEEIYARPQTRFVADFIGKVNFLPAELKEFTSTGSVVSLGGAALKVGQDGTAPLKDTKPGQKVLLVVRPEEFHIGAAEGATLKGTVARVTYLGSTAEYQVKLGNSTITVTGNNPKASGIRPAGTEVGLYFDESNLHVLPDAKKVG